MSRLSHFTIAIARACFFAAVACIPCDAGDIDTAQLQGEWVLTYIEKDGKNAGEEALRLSDYSLIKFKANEVVSYVEQPRFRQAGLAEYELYTTMKGQRIRLTYKLGHSGRRLGLIEVSDDHLRICLGEADGTWPNSFTTAVGDGNTVYSFRRRLERERR